MKSCKGFKVIGVYFRDVCYFVPKVHTYLMKTLALRQQPRGGNH